MILGELFGAIWVIYFPTNCGAKGPQSPPNHRVVVILGFVWCCCCGFVVCCCMALHFGVIYKVDLVIAILNGLWFVVLVFGWFFDLDVVFFFLGWYHKLDKMFGIVFPKHRTNEPWTTLLTRPWSLYNFKNLLNRRVTVQLLFFVDAGESVWGGFASCFIFLFGGGEGIGATIFLLVQGTILRHICFYTTMTYLLRSKLLSYFFRNSQHHSFHLWYIFLHWSHKNRPFM